VKQDNQIILAAMIQTVGGKANRNCAYEQKQIIMVRNRLILYSACDSPAVKLSASHDIIDLI
jgi:hypothetical protein